MSRLDARIKRKTQAAHRRDAPLLKGRWCLLRAAEAMPGSVEQLPDVLPRPTVPELRRRKQERHLRSEVNNFE